MENPDSRLIVQFRMGTVVDGVASEEKGFKVFKDVPWVRIMVPAERDVYDQPAWIDESEQNPHPQAHNIRFPLQWSRFRAGHIEQTPGFPLAEWPQCLRSQVEQLSMLKIRTVEQLAAVNDGALKNLGPGYLSLRQKAQLFIDQRTANAPMEKMNEELSKRDGEISLLKAQMAQLLSAKADETEEVEAPRKRGRPAKHPEAVVE